MNQNCFTSLCDIKKDTMENNSLAKFKFAVKDSINVKGMYTSCGNLSWLKNRKPEAVNAICVDQLLDAGAHLIGKTNMDEMAFSLLGENKDFGTPLNPNAPNRVPGGSSSGSASAVAQRLVDFAIGTDTGGSIRIPSHNCGIYGLRFSHGLSSMCGILPLAQSFDTLGIFSNSLSILSHVTAILCNENYEEKKINKNIFILNDLLHMCEVSIQQIFLSKINSLPIRVKHICLEEILEEIKITIRELKDIFITIQFAEIWSNYGYWIQYEEPNLGENIRKSFQLASKINREDIYRAFVVRNKVSQKLNKFLSENNFLIFPTAPYFAPEKGSIGIDRSVSTYIQDTICFTCLSGFSQTPQISLPVIEKNTLPVGISILAEKNSDVSFVNEIQNLWFEK